MTRRELLSSPEYWLVKIQDEIYRCAEEYMETHQINRTQLADYLGVTKGYVSQILKGDYNYSIEKLVDLSIKLGVVPQFSFEELEELIQMDENAISRTSVSMNAPYFVLYNDNNNNNILAA